MEPVLTSSNRIAVKIAVKIGAAAAVNLVGSRMLGHFQRWATRCGARARNRTVNLGIKSPLLCQLSYAGKLFDLRD